MLTPLLYGMNAGLGMSPHTMGSILMAHQQGKWQGYAFLLGGLMLDLCLIGVIAGCSLIIQNGKGLLS